MNTTVVKDLKPIDTGFENPRWPLLIAGPCSAESEEQVMQTACALKESKRISVFRAGIWKPRTRPGSFEGVGEEGLKWLMRVKKELGLRIATEVATADHVEKALKYDVDVLWVGARTTGNPFSVQTLADALQGAPVSVMVKNPVYPDTQLWLGAIERFSKAGITQLAAIHRGFSSAERSGFRNLPMWNISIELKTYYPSLPVVCDPSHICGRKDLIPYVAQKAIDLDMYGLMVECHINPGEALSDAEQQLTPLEYEQLIDRLSLRNADLQSPVFYDYLNELRRQIDEVDSAILQKLSLRMQLAEDIGRHKKANGATILQLSRWSELLRQRIEVGKAMGLSEAFLKDLMELLHQESINTQDRVMNSGKD